MKLSKSWSNALIKECQRDWEKSRKYKGKPFPLLGKEKELIAAVKRAKTLSDEPRLFRARFSPVKKRLKHRVNSLAKLIPVMEGLVWNGRTNEYPPDGSEESLLKALAYAKEALQRAQDELEDFPRKADLLGVSPARAFTMAIEESWVCWTGEDFSPDFTRRGATEPTNAAARLLCSAGKTAGFKKHELRSAYYLNARCRKTTP